METAPDYQKTIDELVKKWGDVCHFQSAALIAALLEVNTAMNCANQEEFEKHVRRAIELLQFELKDSSRAGRVPSQPFRRSASHSKVEGNLWCLTLKVSFEEAEHLRSEMTGTGLVTLEGVQGRLRSEMTGPDYVTYELLYFSSVCDEKH